MKRLVILVLALSLGLMACSGGGQENSSDKTISLGVAQYADHESLDLTRQGLIDGLEEMGYSVEEDFVNLQGDMTLIDPTAAKFKSDGVDLVYAIATPVAQGMKNAITDIPVVYNAVTDPITAQLEADNVIGVSDYYSIEDQMEIFQKDFPDLSSYGVIYDTAEVNSEQQVEELRNLTNDLGIDLHEVGISSTNDIPQALASLVSQIDALIMITDNMTVAASPIIANSLLEEGIVSYTVAPSPVNDGILVSNGIDYYELGKKAADLVDQIMQGQSPGDLDIIHPDGSKKIVNKSTAQSLGIPDDASLYEGAEIIE